MICRNSFVQPYISSLHETQSTTTVTTWAFFPTDISFGMSLLVLRRAKTTSGTQSINKSTEALLWDRFKATGLRPQSNHSCSIQLSIKQLKPCKLIYYFPDKPQRHRYLSSALCQIKFMKHSLTHRNGNGFSRGPEHHNIRRLFISGGEKRDKIRFLKQSIRCNLSMKIQSTVIKTSFLPETDGWLHRLILRCLGLGGGQALQKTCTQWWLKHTNIKQAYSQGR